jgi:hypothetical protein
MGLPGLTGYRFPITISLIRQPGNAFFRIWLPDLTVQDNNLFFTLENTAADLVKAN